VEVSLLLIACVISGPGSLEIPAPGPDLIPKAPRFAPGLPGPIKLDDGVKLPTPLDQATADLIGYCVDHYPKLCAEACEQVKRVEGVRCNGRLAVLTSQWRERAIQVASEDALDDRWPRWVSVLLGVGALTVGAAAGYLVGNLAR